MDTPLSGGWGGQGSRQMRNANDEIMEKPSPKTKQSLQAAKALKPKVVEHKNKVQPQVCEARPTGQISLLSPLAPAVKRRCFALSVCVFECAYLIIHTLCLPTKCKNA